MRSGTLVAFLALSFGQALPAVAQDVCRPGPDSHEAHTMAILAVPVAFSAGGAIPGENGRSIGLEFATLPTVDRVTATPTSCRPGKGPENTNPIAGLVRPRVALMLNRFAVEVAWIPPIRVHTVRANLVSAAVSWAAIRRAGWSGVLRASGTLGTLHAPVTCDAAALADPSSICYQGTLSDDSWRPNVLGADGVVGRTSGSWRPYLGAGISLLRPRFQVNFTDASGFTDRRRVEVNLQRAAVFGGLEYRTGRARLAIEGYGTAGDAVTIRGIVRTTW